MPEYRSRTVTHGRNMAGARALLRAAGVEKADLGRKPIIAVANSYTQFVPGHTHLKPVGEIVADAVIAAGGIPREFNTIAVDDGIAMGHGGMLYSLPSRDLIADSVEYMVNAHCADALICISNCDKITPGMLNAALRLNIPTVFVSGGPMEGGTAVLVDGTVRTRVNLITAISDAVADEVSDEDIAIIEESACPTCGSCSGMFTANSMNCLTEALGLALPGNGSTLATHTARAALYRDAGHAVVDITARYYEGDDASVLPRNIATREAFENAMALDVAMGGSTNTVLHLLAAAQEAELDFTMQDIDDVSRRVPCLTKLAPNGTYLMEDAHRAGGIPAILGELHRGGLLHTGVRSVHSPSLEQWLAEWDIRGGFATAEAIELFHAAPGCVRSATAGSQSERWESLDTDAAEGCIRDIAHAHSRDGGLAILYGNIALDGCVVKTAGVDESILRFSGPARVCRVPGRGRRTDPQRRRARGRRGRDPLRRAQGRPGHAGDALPDLLPQGPRAREGVRADHRRALQRRHLRALDRPCVARGRRRRRDRVGGGGRHDRDQHPGAHDLARRHRRRVAGAPRGAGGDHRLRAGRARARGLPRPARLRRDGDLGRPRRDPRRLAH